jgi:hypothetical protein
MVTKLMPVLSGFTKGRTARAPHGYWPVAIRLWPSQARFAYPDGGSHVCRILATPARRWC